MLAPTRWRFRRRVAAQSNVASAITTANLTAVARTRMFFDHQSVGVNVLDAVSGVYADHGVSAPPIEQGRAEPGPNGGFIAHESIEENGKPPLEDFDRAMRGGMARQVDVAVMNLCWEDINGNTDVDALFARYRDTMAALERDFPNVTFIHVTVPLTTELSLFAELKTRLRTLLGRSDVFSQRANVTRERMDARSAASRRPSPLRPGSDRSTKPDGTRVSGATTIRGISRCTTGTPPTGSPSTRLVPRSRRQPFSRRSRRPRGSRHRWR